MGEEGHQPGMLYQPTGLALTKELSLVAVSSNNNFLFKYFRLNNCTICFAVIFINYHILHLLCQWDIIHGIGHLCYTRVVSLHFSSVHCDIHSLIHCKQLMENIF